MTCGLKEPPPNQSVKLLRKQLALDICARDDRFKKE